MGKSKKLGDNDERAPGEFAKAFNTWIYRHSARNIGSIPKAKSLFLTVSAQNEIYEFQSRICRVASDRLTPLQSPGRSRFKSKSLSQIPLKFLKLKSTKQLIRPVVARSAFLRDPTSQVSMYTNEKEERSTETLPCHLCYRCLGEFPFYALHMQES
jgi:hypothetical protein